MLAAHRERFSWDAPIHSIDGHRGAPYPPRMVNIKPSRLGGLRNLLDAYDYCAAQGIGNYGGGQFELGVGRGQNQYLASLFHPDAPNDVAPDAASTCPSRRAGLPVEPARAGAARERLPLGAERRRERNFRAAARFASRIAANVGRAGSGRSARRRKRIVSARRSQRWRAQRAHSDPASLAAVDSRRCARCVGAPAGAALPTARRRRRPPAASRRPPAPAQHGASTPTARRERRGSRSRARDDRARSRASAACPRRNCSAQPAPGLDPRDAAAARASG